MCKKLIATITLVMAINFSIEPLLARADVKALLAISALNTAHMGTEHNGILTKQFWRRPLQSKNRAKLARLLLLSVSPVVAAALLHWHEKAPVANQSMAQAIAPTAPSSTPEASRKETVGPTPKPSAAIVETPKVIPEDPRCIVELEVGEAKAIDTVIPQIEKGIAVTRKRLDQVEDKLEKLKHEKIDVGNACSEAVCDFYDPEYDKTMQESYEEFEALKDALRAKDLYDLWNAAQRVAGTNFEERKLKKRYADALAAAPDIQTLEQRYTENEKRRNAVLGECMERARCAVSPEYAALTAKEAALQKESHELKQEYDDGYALSLLQDAAEIAEKDTDDRFARNYPKHREAIEKSPGFKKVTQNVAAAQAALQAEYPEFVALTTQLEDMHQGRADFTKINSAIKKLASLKKSLEKDARFAELCHGIEPLAAYKRAMLKELDKDYAQTRAEYLAALKERQEAIKSHEPLIKKLTARRASSDDEAESDEE